MTLEYNGPVSEMQEKALDYWMYQHAAKQLSRDKSDADFEDGYAKGLYRFASDKALLADLLERYDIRMQMLGREWLASTEAGSQFGSHPILAACRLVVAQEFGEVPKPVS